jgi:hypothetical protein
MDRSKIVIAQFYTSNVSYGQYAEAVNKKYCDEKGYTYFCEKDNNKIQKALIDRAYTWYKPLLIEEIIETLNPEYVLFLDIDAVVSDFNQNIEDFIDSNYSMIFTQDVGHHSAMNAGVFILKNNDWSKKFLRTWYESADTFTPEDSRDLPIMEQNFRKVGYFKQALWHDQTCLTTLYENNKDVSDNINIISSRYLNHNTYNEENFIFHAYAYGHVENRTIDIIYREKFDLNNDLENINLIVYHIYCVGNYVELVTQQLNRLKTSGLYNWCDKLEITCTNTEGDFSKIEELIKDLSKANLQKQTVNFYEWEGVSKVWDYSQKHDGKVFYFHTKGVSNTYVNLESNQLSDKKKKGIGWWKEIMEYYLIDNYKDCIEKLDSYNQCGVTNNNNWWWGNFWWSNLQWIRFNPEPVRGDRWYYEAWLNSHRNPSYHEYYHFEFNPYYTHLPDDIYINKEAYKDSKIEVTSAFYGISGEQQDEGRKILDRSGMDVTEEIKANLATHNYRGFCIRVDNNIAGDPYFGFEKVLEINFTIDGKEYIITADENRNLKFEL